MYIVLDTNAYRNFIFGKTNEEIDETIHKIVRRQEELGIISLMSTTVARELICHLFDNGVFDETGDCTKAIRAMYGHCGDVKTYNLVPLPETQLSMELFGTHNTKAEEQQKAVTEIVFNVFINPTIENLEPYLSNIERIKSHNNEAECELEGMLTKLKNIKLPNDMTFSVYAASENFKKETATAYICALAIDLDIIPSKDIRVDGNKTTVPSIIIEKAEEYLKRYPAPIEMRSNLISKLDMSNFNPSKKERLNQIWDEQILHLVNRQICGEPIILVTSDKGMISAIDKAYPASVSTISEPFGKHIISLDEYLSYLNV